MYNSVCMCVCVCVFVFSNDTCTSTLCVHLYSSLHLWTELSNILIIVSIIMIELFGATPKLIDLNCVLFIRLLVVVFCSSLEVLSKGAHFFTKQVLQECEHCFLVSRIID